MNENKTVNTNVQNRHKAGMLLRLSAIVGLMSVGLVACATVESQPAEPIIIEKVVMYEGLDSVSVVYNSGDYQVALAEFKAISLDEQSSANSRRMAYLGEALIYLSSDKNWHSLENAKMTLHSAGQVTTTSNEEFSLAADMLMDAITITIGTESRYTELRSKSSNSNSEVTRLKAERDALLAENETLRKKQVALNDALERLKNLTLGN